MQAASQSSVPATRRLTCTVAISTNPAQLEAAHRQRTYAFRADGRTGSVRRGSPVLQSDLILLYVADPSGDGTRRPNSLKIEQLFVRGFVTRHTSGGTIYEARPAVRLNARWLRRCTGEQIRYDAWPEERSKGDNRAPLVHEKAAGAIARTEGSDYMLVPLLPFTEIQSTDPDKEAEVREAWTSWSGSLIKHWERETREDDFGEPFVRVLPSSLSEQLAELAPVLSVSVEERRSERFLDAQFRPTKFAAPERQ